MSRSKRLKALASLMLSVSLFPCFSVAQIVLPPSVVKQQADRSQRDQKNADSDEGASREKGHRGPSDQSRQIEAMKAVALGNDPIAAIAAVRHLQSLGDPAKNALTAVVRQMLAHDRVIIENAHGGQGAAELRALSDKILAERQEARINIDKLAHDETIPAAHKHFDSLKAMWEKLRGALSQADLMTRALSRRGELLTIWKGLMPDDKQYPEDAEAKLAAKSERLFGFTAGQMQSIPELEEGDPPSEPVLRDLWFYRACRRIEAFNAWGQKFMAAPEIENAQFVNTYRECLGILPYELDPRLVDSARGHSKEMVTLKYFAHESPVPANKTPWDRIKTAGYEHGSGENIAAGVGKGEQAFWMWFDSPGHHQNMARIGNTTLGVGLVGVTWTQNMGSGPRLMLATPEERNSILANAKLLQKNG